MSNSNLQSSTPTASSLLYRYLLGAMQQIQITMTVRYSAVQEEVDRLPKIVEAWRSASARMQQLLTTEAGAAEEILVQEPPAEIADRLREIEADPLFRASFSDAPTSFKIVEIDKLIAPQRDVNLDYVSALQAQVPGKSVTQLVEFCVGPRRTPPEMKALQTAQNQMTFTSPSLDLRFLGGFPKELGEEDIKAAHLGGQPVAVVALLVGFGAAPINAWMVGKRLILANGFHRIVALRQEGIALAPIVVRQIASPEIEFPEQFLGLPRSYLLQHIRPVLVKDFFDRALTLDLKLKRRNKTLKVAWGPEDGIVPE